MKKLIIKGMDKRYFSEKIVKWYLNHKRNLPWRDTKDPYKIWLSEIILQQTRVAQGLPYYLRFLEHYPTVNKLAAAREQDVLRLWEGLGYYTRARNLHKCAKAVVELYKGKFPGSYAELLILPGIGEYTAAAIASFAYKEKIAVVDGNVFRVIARLFGIDTPINSLQGRREFSLLANDLIQAADPDLHNQAIMEFGATCCLPKNPKCDTCVFQKNCFAFQRAMQDVLPTKLKGKPSRKRYFNYVVTEYKGELFMQKRTEKDIWTGLYDFHLIEKKRPVKVEKLLSETGLIERAELNFSPKVSKTYKHVLSHQTIFSKFIIIKSRKKLKLNGVGRFYSLKEVNSLPKPVLISRFLADHYVL